MNIRTVAAIFLSSTNFAICEGVLVFKEQEFHSNDSATAQKFETVNPQGFVTWFTTDERRVRFEATQWFRYIEFPPQLHEAVDPSILPARLVQLKSLEEFSTKYKKASPFLQQPIVQVRLETENLKNGLVFHENAWVPKTEYQAEEKRKADEIVQKARDKEAQEETRKQQEIIRLKLASELQAQKTDERRAVKIQDLKDKIGGLAEEKSGIQSQNKILCQELLNIVNRENSHSGK